MARTKEGKIISGKVVISPKKKSKNTKSSQKALQKVLSKPIIKKRKFKIGTLCLKEIRKYQTSTDLLIRKLPFQRMIREMLEKGNNNFRISSSAVYALQEATEAFIISILEDANLCSFHAKRVTLMGRDVRLTQRIKGLTN